MVRHSHIEDLKQCIGEVISNTELVRLQRLDQERYDFLIKLIDQKQKVEAEFNLQKTLLTDGFIPFQNSLKSLRQFVDMKAQQYINF